MSEIPPPPPPQPPPTEPGAPPPPIPRPFAPEPKPLPGGCSRPFLIGCGTIVVLFGIAAIIFVAKAKDLLAWTMREVEKQVVLNLPADVPEDERARLERGFDAAIARMQKGEVETPALYALQSQLMNAADKSQKRAMTRDDVLDLLSALERVGGLLPADGEPAEEGPAEGALPPPPAASEAAASPPPP